MTELNWAAACLAVASAVAWAVEALDAFSPIRPAICAAKEAIDMLLDASPPAEAKVMRVWPDWAMARAPEPSPVARAGAPAVADRFSWA